MKNTKKFFFKLAALIAISFNANAIDFEWKACKSEIANLCKGEKDNEKIWACLQTYDIDLSTECDIEHSEYEKLTGKIVK